MATPVIQMIPVFVQIGDEVIPLVEAAITDVVAFAQAHGGNDAVIAQLTADKATIAADQQQLADEQTAIDDAAKPPV
jgi:hypothetical protein